jgi:hypothetical protein
VEVLDLLPPVPGPSPSFAPAGPRPGSTNLAARIGLVLSLVLVLAGVAGAVAKSGDDGTDGRRTTAAADPLDEDPASGPAGADADPLDADPLDAPAAVEVPDGFELRQGDGMALAVPADWTSLDRDDIRRITTGENVERAFPDLDPSMIDAVTSAVDGGAIFMAIDTSGPDAGRNINMIRVSGEAPLGILDATIEEQYADMGFPAEVLDTERHDTPLGTALRVRVRETVGGEDLEIVQYYVPFDGSTYIITGTAADDVVDQAVGTLRAGDTV